MLEKQKLWTRGITMAAAIAAVYVILTYVCNLFGLASGVIQVRFSEALTILPAILPAPFVPFSVAGLTIGCALANTLTFCAPWDILFGSIATLIGALGTWLLRKNLYIAWIPPVLSNAIIVPFILIYVYGATDAYWYLVLTVGAGEVISCGVLGLIFAKAMKKPLRLLFPDGYESETKSESE